MFQKSQVLCWVVTDGKIGMENQCLGLSEALSVRLEGMTTLVKRVRLKSPWRQFSPFLRVGLKHAYSDKGDRIAQPWPDIMIVSGRAAIPAALWARRESKGRTFTVHIQNPIIDPSRFDLVVAPRHDDLWRDNVITTRGSMHRVTPKLLKEEGDHFAERFKSLPHPIIAVAIGGNNSVYRLTTDAMETIATKLQALAKETSGSLVITTSRRTGAENLALLTSKLKDVSGFIWDGKGENPYYAMLHYADAILVTCDSVNMVSEACSTGKPVHIIPLAGGSEKFRHFHQTLYDDGLTRPFTGVLERWTYHPLDDVSLVADRIICMLERKNRPLA